MPPECPYCGHELLPFQSDVRDHSPVNNFRVAIERIIWANSNLSTEDRAAVLREFAEELEADESPYEDQMEHVRKLLKDMGYRMPEMGDE